ERKSRDAQYRGPQIAGGRARGTRSSGARTPQRLAELFARPEPRQECGSLFQALYAHLLPARHPHFQAGAGEGRLRELYVLRPDRMRVVPGADGWASAYEYTVAGTTMRFDQSAPPVPPILHLTFFHPLDDHYGLAPLEAAAVAVDTHNAAAKWNKALL